MLTKVNETVEMLNKVGCEKIADAHGVQRLLVEMQEIGNAAGKRTP